MVRDSTHEGSPSTVDKLTQALSELREQRSAIDTAIKHVEDTLGLLKFNVANGTVELNKAEQSQPRFVRVRRGTYFAEACVVLGKIAAPLHINELHRYVETKTGKTLTRASLEGVLTRHLRQQGDRSLIVRVAPSTYTLRRLAHVRPSSDLPTPNTTGVEPK